MTDTHVEVENKQPARKFTFKALLEYETIMTRAAARMLCQLEYWWPRKEGPEVYKSDQEFADEIGISLSHFKAIKKYLSKIIKLFKTRVAFLNGKKVTYYGEIDYAELDRLISAKKDTLKSENNTLVKYENQTLLDQSKVRKSDFTRTKIRLCTLYTDTTTDITYNPAGLENNLHPNQSDLGNLSDDQKSGSEVDRSAFREESILDEPPTPKNEESIEEEKAVEPPLPTLQAGDTKAPKKPKAEGKVSKPKVQATRINPNMELTPERMKMALDVRRDDKGLKEECVKSIFEDFKYHYQNPELKSSQAYHVDWDRVWQNWCRNNIKWDEKGKTSMINPPRTTVSDKPAEEELPIDEKFKDFVSKHPANKFYFEGAVFHEIRDNVLVIIQDGWKGDQLARVNELKSWFSVKHLRVYAKVSNINCFAKNKPEQIAISPGDSADLDKTLANMAHGINLKEIKENTGMKVVSSNPEKSTSVSNTLSKPPYNSVKPMQHREFEEKQIGSGKS